MAAIPLPMPPITVNAPLADEVRQFRNDCENRYKFNSRWDNTLNIAGLLLSVSIVAAGLFEKGAVAAILGAFVSAIVSAQRAFPFGPRANFYRVLIGQADNLQTQIQQELLETPAAVAGLNSLRLDFAQQFPRGSSFKTDDPAGDKPA
jgi:hypothetical protein